MRDRIRLLIGANTGPFKNALELVFVKGITLLVADNLTGKSTIMGWLANFFGASPKLRADNLLINDGAGNSAVAKITYGDATITCSRGERPELERGDYAPLVERLPNLIQILVTGAHHEGSRPAFKARLRALCAWCGIVVDKPFAAALRGDDSAISRISIDSTEPDEAVDQLRKGIFKLRQDEEEKLAKLRKAHDQVFGERTAALGGFDEDLVRDTIPAVSAARAKAEAARDALGAARGARETGLAAEERLQRQIAAQPERPDVAAAETAVDLAAANFQKSANLVAEQQAVIAELQRQLSEAKVELAARFHKNGFDGQTKEQAEDALAAAQESARQWDAAQERLREGLSFPSEDDVAAAEQAAKLAADGVKLAEAAATYARLTVDIDAKVEAMRGIEHRIAYLKGESDGVWNRLAEEVSRRLQSDEIRINTVPKKGAKIKDGEEPELVQVIEVRINGQWWDITDTRRVSEGAWVGVAFRLLIQHGQRRRSEVIVIEGATPLGPTQMDQIGELAIEAGLWIILETAAEALPGVLFAKYFPPLEEAP